MLDWLKVEQHLTASIEQDFTLTTKTRLSGGDTNQAYRLDGVLDENKAVSYFIKFNEKSRLEMFEAEADGLQEMRAAKAIRVPRAVCVGIEKGQSYLVLENLSLASVGEGSAKQLGEQIAALHKKTSNQYGWLRDNTIGATKQANRYTDDWISFWREQRLGFQLEQAKEKGASRSLIIKGEKLLTNLDAFFYGYTPDASLLHGDLWSGNYGFLESGEPVIFDPAVYYGDRETDMAMTELFGGFPAEFYSAYNKAWPLHEGYQRRKTLYNLYHILNHYNLFGGGYEMQAENMMDNLLDN